MDPMARVWFCLQTSRRKSNSNNIELKLHFEIPELGNVSNVFSCLLSSNFRLLS